MLQLSPGQFTELDEFAMRSFDTRTLAHLQQHFPEHCSGLGEARVRLAIRRGWQAAVAHGWTPECCVRAYIEFSCLLGSGFDADPRLPWAAAVLAGTGIVDPVSDADRLHDLVWAQWRRQRQDLVDVHGGLSIDGMLARIDGLLAARELDTASPVDMPTRLSTWLRSALPARLEPLDDAQLLLTISALRDRAAEAGWVGGRATSLYVLLAALMGSGFLDDLLVPWPAASDAAARPGSRPDVDMLAQHARATLPRWWPMAARLSA